MKSGNLNFLEPSSPLQACNGTDLPFLSDYTVSRCTGVSSVCTYLINRHATYVCFNCASYELYMLRSFLRPSSDIHSFHWHMQNAMIPRRSPGLLPFLSVLYFFLPSFSTNYSSILSRLILPSICWSTSQSCFSKIHILIIPFWESYFLPFSVHAQTNVIYLTLSIARHANTKII